MQGIEILVEEHKKIIQLTQLFQHLCCNMIDGREVDVQVFQKGIEFARNYADKYHHGKEEKILFRIMEEKLGTIAVKLIHQGMLVEHDLGRYHLTELEAALDRFTCNPTTQEKLNIITHGAGYANLLQRHIEKEDAVVYTFAERMLSVEDKETVDKETMVFEKEVDKLYMEELIGWIEKHKN